MQRNPVARTCGLIAALLLVSAGAEARTERLRWYHDKPGAVANFIVYWGYTSNEHHAQIDVGKPNKNGKVFRFDLVVPDDAQVYVAVRAVGHDGGASGLSNSQVRAALDPPPPDPGPVDPPPSDPEPPDPPADPPPSDPAPDPPVDPPPSDPAPDPPTAPPVDPPPPADPGSGGGRPSVDDPIGGGSRPGGDFGDAEMPDDESPPGGKPPKVDQLTGLGAPGKPEIY